MPSIAVICAHNPRNNGMYCVDWAARRYFGSLGCPYDLCITQGRTHIGALRYHLVKRAEDLAGYDTVVYWGDFLNNPMWGTRDYIGRTTRTRHPVPSDLEEWIALYLDLKSVLPQIRTVVAGGCALGAGSPLASSPELAGAFRRFLDQVDRIIVRDPGSFETLSGMGVSEDKLSLGFDRASLLRPFAPARWKGRYFVHSFHRTLKPKEAGPLIERIESLTGLKGIPIRWLKNKWLRPIYQGKLSLQMMLMRHARFCISDIYHFSICSMVQGTPAYCLTKPESNIQTTTNEVKKRFLYQMVDLPEFLIEWAPGWERAVDERFGAWQEERVPLEGWETGFTASQHRLRSQLDEVFR